jgi:hypothetical protein
LITFKREVRNLDNFSYSGDSDDFPEINRNFPYFNFLNIFGQKKFKFLDEIFFSKNEKLGTFPNFLIFSEFLKNDFKLFTCPKI